MDGLNKRQTACQTAMDHEPVIGKMDTATSMDETILQPDEESFDSYSNIDEAATLHPPESTDFKININPFTNPFFDYVVFDNPLAHLDATEQNEMTICAEWILKHQAYFNK
ncbi:hypothetical protein HNY73_014392 [Argiope bruennichi]|uniref:Uncharacterized protein n=1 Tax=Argiope bruennichi TaxID=94029 RepID=A0A8T0EQ94_ARGBR|nr:hypothetical protein HNY73_014392 [Argiope bruennichi]